MAENKHHHGGRKPHAIVIPYPLQGHVNPSVHLAVKLASQGFIITFVNTHYIHHRTTSTAAGNGDGGDDVFAGVRESGLDIRYATVSDGLPLGFDRSLNRDRFMASLLHVFSAHVEELVAEIVAAGDKKEEAVSVLVADTYFVWPSKVAKKFDRREDAIDYIPGVKRIEPKDTTWFLQQADETSIIHQIIFKAFQDAKGADFIIANTVQELESDTILGLQETHTARLYAIGPIFPSGFNTSPVSTSLWSESDCTRWLNSKPPGSVLYASFGSYSHMAKPELMEIARGLALSRVSFLWVLRDDIVRSDEPDPLPIGFKEEVSDRAIIVRWCNQKEVLGHVAVGGFLTHCGWNSVLESIWCMVPLLCFPLHTDQFTNRKLVVDDWKVGINLNDQTVVTKEEVSRNVNRLMDGKSRCEIQKKVKEAKEIFAGALRRDGSSEQNFRRFVEQLMEKIM